MLSSNQAFFLAYLRDHLYSRKTTVPENAVLSLLICEKYFVLMREKGNSVNLLGM